MNKIYLLEKLAGYRDLLAGQWPKEISTADFELDTIQRFLSFIDKNDDCFERSNLYGHITGSAMVLSRDHSQVVLTLHKKLGKWLQLGGHSDGNPLTWQVAKSEVEEESGLKDFLFLDPLNAKVTTNPELVLPFDFDIHLIPAKKDAPEHFHFDVRFLLVAQEESLEISDESDDLRWFDLTEVPKVTTEVSTLRQLRKIQWLLH
jgi:8-oxo-dGTP pyrophosphatase MutT (NUDIX family)